MMEGWTIQIFVKLCVPKTLCHLNWSTKEKLGFCTTSICKKQNISVNTLVNCILMFLKLIFLVKIKLNVWEIDCKDDLSSDLMMCTCRWTQQASNIWQRHIWDKFSMKTQSIQMMLIWLCWWLALIEIAMAVLIMPNLLMNLLQKHNLTENKRCLISQIWQYIYNSLLIISDNVFSN